MIVTRSWLDEFIDLDDVSNDRLYEVFNAIGLEVDNISTISIPDGVVIGKILSCEKHPNADKLNVCQIDIGEGIRQIVCGAANVVDAQYVAVATVGTTLGEDFLIKPAELRGVQSDGMVCSSTELGLPKINDGIMILDESIGIINIGQSINQYHKIADTIIELELTANRGDCLSIRGVARDLGAALQKDLRQESYKNHSRNNKIATAKILTVNNNTNIDVDLLFKLTEVEEIGESCLILTRLALVGLELDNRISNILSYSTHATGVILRAYDTDKLQNSSGLVNMQIIKNEVGLVELTCNDITLSTIGVNQNSDFLANQDSKRVLYAASYIEPEGIIEGVANSDAETDTLYYKTSRGSEPELKLGMTYLEECCFGVCTCKFSDTYVEVNSNRKKDIIGVNFAELESIIGQEISGSLISGILSRLGFDMKRSRSADSFGAIVPAFRHDINHIQDIAEEVLRIVGINNINAKPLELVEKVRLTDSTLRYKAKRDIRNRAVGRGFFEAVTYAFCDKTKLKKYGFSTTIKSLELLNPIAKEFDEMRSTLLINLLESVKRNTSYGIKRVPLFEIGTVFNNKREEKEKIAFVWSGNNSTESVSNSGKSKSIDFASFVQKVASVIGQFDLKACPTSNGLMHPYQSAEIIVSAKSIGYISKLHPEIATDFGISDTFIAEIDFESIMPKHIDATAISNYQGVFKDLSIVVDENTNYSDLATSIKALDNELLKSFYAVDVYHDESLQNKKSLTIRLFIQSAERTLSEEMIDTVVQGVLNIVTKNHKATLR